MKALALVAHKLYGTCQEAATTAAEADPAAAVLLREHVVKALLAAVEDYSTDNRSDLSPQHSQDSCASRTYERLCFDAKDGLLATICCLHHNRVLSTSRDSRKTMQTTILLLWHSSQSLAIPQVTLQL